jgi:hypothetical protein
VLPNVPMRIGRLDPALEGYAKAADNSFEESE